MEGGGEEGGKGVEMVDSELEREDEPSLPYSTDKMCCSLPYFAGPGFLSEPIKVCYPRAAHGESRVVSLVWGVGANDAMPPLDYDEVSEDSSIIQIKCEDVC